MALARSVYPDAMKRRAVKYANRIGSATLAAEKFEVWESMIRRWARDPRYGGKADAFTRAARSARARGPRKPNGAANSIGLPLSAARKQSERVKDAIPVLFACPHCGGRIRMGGEA